MLTLEVCGSLILKGGPPCLSETLKYTTEAQYLPITHDPEMRKERVLAVNRVIFQSKKHKKC